MESTIASKEADAETISFDEGDFTNVGIAKASGLQISIMPLVRVQNDEHTALGTCFAISNDGLALTARHVIEEALNLQNENKSWAEGIDIFALYESSNVDEETGHFIGGPLRVMNVWFNDTLDIAVLQLAVPTNTKTGEKLRLPANAISPGLPKVGEHIFGFGYHAMKCETADDHLEIERTFSATRGLVEEVHFPRRDAIMLPFPCFRTSARFDGGMSGGPIISMSGQVCGVICSAMEMADRDSSFTSYGSLVAPALLIAISGLDQEGKFGELFLYECVIGGAVKLDETSSTVQITSSGRRIILDYGEGRTMANSLTPPTI